jgi:hypothetical protein
VTQRIPTDAFIPLAQPIRASLSFGPLNLLPLAASLPALPLRQPLPQKHNLPADSLTNDVKCARHT